MERADLLIWLSKRVLASLAAAAPLRSENANDDTRRKIRFDPVLTARGYGSLAGLVLGPPRGDHERHAQQGRRYDELPRRHAWRRFRHQRNKVGDRRGGRRWRTALEHERRQGERRENDRGPGADQPGRDRPELLLDPEEQRGEQSGDGGEAKHSGHQEG